jgi:hypothetical protein
MITGCPNAEGARPEIRTGALGAVMRAAAAGSAGRGSAQE